LIGCSLHSFVISLPGPTHSRRFNTIITQYIFCLITLTEVESNKTLLPQKPATTAGTTVTDLPRSSTLAPPPPSIKPVLHDDGKRKTDGSLLLYLVLAAVFISVLGWLIALMLSMRSSLQSVATRLNFCKTNTFSCWILQVKKKMFLYQCARCVNFKFFIRQCSVGC